MPPGESMLLVDWIYEVNPLNYSAQAAASSLAKAARFDFPS